MDIIRTVANHYMSLVRLFVNRNVRGAIVIAIRIHRRRTVFDDRLSFGSHPSHVSGVVSQCSNSLIEHNISVNVKHTVVRAIEFVSKPPRILSRERAYVACRSQNAVTQRMVSEHNILEFIIDEFRRAVVVRLNFIANHLHFLIDFRLWVSAVEHNVRQEVGSE